MAKLGQECRFRVWLPTDMDGVIDLMLRIDETDDSFFDALEAAIVRDPTTKGFKLESRNHGKDIPSHLFPMIEKTFLAPVTDGELKPGNDTVYGKGIMLVVDAGSGRKTMDLDELEIISKQEYRKTAN